MDNHRCVDCCRPICQRILSTDDSCDDGTKNRKRCYDGDVIGGLVNSVTMHDLFSG